MKKNNAPDDDDEEEEMEYVLFQGAVNGKDANLDENKKLAAAGLAPAKEFVSDAVGRRAEVVKLEPQGDRAVATFYVDGLKRQGPKFPIQRANAITQILKLLAGLDITVKDKPQIGGIKATYKENKIEVTIKSTPVKGGELLTVMYRNLKIKREKPDDLGTPDIIKKTIRDYTAQKKGIVVFAGPPESGLTTTALSLLRCVDVYLYQGFILGNLGSREVVNVPLFKPEAGHSLDTTIDRIKRNDGDLIYFDTFNNEEYLKTSFRRAQDLAILSEFNAADAADAIVKICDTVGDRQVVCDNLRCVVSHKLFRKLCSKCKEAFRPSPAFLAKIGLPEDTKVLYRKPEPPEPDPKTGELPDPCPMCDDAGFRTRTIIFEMIDLTPTIKEVILSGGDADAIRAQAKKEKQLTFQQDALRLVADGTTGLEELQRVFRPPQPAGAKSGLAKKAVAKRPPPR